MTDDDRIKRLAKLSARNKRSRASERRMVKANSEPDTITIGEAAAQVVDDLSRRCTFVTTPRR